MNRILHFFLLLPFSLAAQNNYDIIIRNGKIIDGTGNSWYYADIAIKDGKIASIQNHITGNAAKQVDAKGLIVAPGFIDVHGHIETSIFERPTADNYIYDGVTTVITGNCGGSADNLQQFFYRVDSMGSSINVASLAGHNTVRRLIMGNDNRLATAAEQQQNGRAGEKGHAAGSCRLIYRSYLFTRHVFQYRRSSGPGKSSSHV